MGRLIDADALKKSLPETRVDVFENCRNCTLLDKEQVNELIDAAPTVDIDRPTRSQFKRMAVQLGYEAVVHCKECKHLMFSDCYGECGAARMGIVSPDDFCSYGERKTNEQ